MWIILQTESRSENNRNVTYALVRCSICNETLWRRKHSLSRAHRCNPVHHQPGDSHPDSSWVILSLTKYHQAKGYSVRCSICSAERIISASDFNSGMTCQCQKYSKTEATTLARHGVKNILISPENRAKIDYSQAAESNKKTMRIRYGVDNYSQTDIHRENLRKLKTIHQIDGQNLAEWSQNNGVSYSAVVNLLNRFDHEFVKKWAKELRQTGSSSVETAFLQAVPWAERYDRYLPDLKIKPDFRLSDTVFVECDGLYIHSELGKLTRNHHLKRRELALSAGYSLKFFRSDEIIFKPEIVASMCAVSVGRVERKIPGRKCSIRHVSRAEAINFLNQNHLMGADHAASSLGLYYKDELVSLVTYRRKGDTALDISRFCTALNTLVMGGYTKLMKAVEELHPDKDIESWVDLRYADGHSLLKNGYEHQRTVLSFRWTDGIVTYPRQYCRATDTESQQEVANRLKLYKIWDCGQALYKKTRT